MHNVNVILDELLSTRPDCLNAIVVTTITQVIANSVYAKVLGPQYHRNLNHRIAAALNRDPNTLITKVYQKNNNHDVISVRTMEVDPSKSDSTTTRYRVSAYFIFDVHHDGAASDTLNVSNTLNGSNTLNAVMW